MRGFFPRTLALFSTRALPLALLFVAPSPIHAAPNELWIEKLEVLPPATRTAPAQSSGLPESNPTSLLLTLLLMASASRPKASNPSLSGPPKPRDP